MLVFLDMSHLVLTVSENWLLRKTQLVPVIISRFVSLQFLLQKLLLSFTTKTWIGYIFMTDMNFPLENFRMFQENLFA